MILFSLAIILSVISGGPGLFRRFRAWSALFSTASLFLALMLLLGQATRTWFGAGSQALSVEWSLPGARWSLNLDSLALFGMIPVLLVSTAVSHYSKSYFHERRQEGIAARVRLGLGFTAAAMLVLLASANALLFLMAWEIMAILGFLMITAEERNQEARQAGWIYLAASHVGALCLFGGFALLAQSRGSFELGPISRGFIHSPSGTAALWLFTLGFGLKAGTIPLHVWLPEAHAAAPAPVSAFLSGVMIKMGILGLVRLLAWIPDPPLWWAGLLVGLGVLSGILGLLTALGQKDLKRLLAYSSVENIGIMFLGLGLAVAGKAQGQTALWALGTSGLLLHLLNHALFKPLLFMGAGAVQHGAGTRNLNALGGLAARMPRTAFFFLMGSVAIVGLPPLNGFASEWLIYLGAFRALESSGWTWAAVVAVSLAAIGGLALACFAKAFGLTFLGSPRSVGADQAHESPLPMLQAMAALALLCLIIGLAPILLAPIFDQILILQGYQPAPLVRMARLPMLSLFAGFLLLPSWLIWSWIRRIPSTRSGTWDCGYAAPSPRMQYTSHSFGRGFVHAVRWLLGPQTEGPDIRRIFPRPSRMTTSLPDLVLTRFIQPSAQGLAKSFQHLHGLQSGHVQLYLLYVVLTIVALFAWILV